MSTYRVKTSFSDRTALAGSTQCVLLTSGVLADLASVKGYAYATDSGDVFTFYDSSTFQLGPPINLEVDTLDCTLAGQQVLIADTDGKWRLGTVVSDGTTVRVDGVGLPATTRAAYPLRGYASPMPKRIVFGTTTSEIESAVDLNVYVEAGTSANGLTWFSTEGGGTGSFYAESLTTLGALQLGNVPALLEKETGKWSIVFV